MNIEWTEQEFERAKTLWQKGERARNIAIELGKSKNAVLAKLHRANAHIRDVEPAYLRHYYKPKNPVERKPKAPRAKPAAAATAVEPEPTAPEPNPNPVRRVTIRFLKRNSCRYPMSDDPRTTPPSKFLYCGAKITHGAYCEVHAQLAYVPLRSGGARSAEREMMRMIVQPTKPADEPKLLDRDVA